MGNQRRKNPGGDSYAQMAAKTADAGLSRQGPVADSLFERVLVHLLQKRPNILGGLIGFPPIDTVAPQEAFFYFSASHTFSNG
jgi:hypothetical protein